MDANALVRVPVKSTHIKEIAWGNNILEVTFLSGVRYRYPGVPKEVWDAFQEAESKGSYFYRNIRRYYVGEKIE